MEIWFAARGPTLYVLSFARADWVRNVQADPRVRIRIGTQRRRASGRLVEPGSEEDSVARRLALAKYQSPGSTDLEGWGRTALVVAFDLEAEP